MKQITLSESTMKKITCTCTRCSYEWIPTINTKGEVLFPKKCANQKCKSPYWHTKPTRSNAKAFRN